MIVSVHISKTAGTAFGAMLSDTWGDRVLFDYGDWVGTNTDEAVRRRAGRALEAHARKSSIMNNYDVIHGHFIADKYAHIFPNADFVTFFRDPYQQAVSNYEYIKRNPQIDHPGVREFHRNNVSLHQYIELTGNVQTQFVGKFTLDQFSIIGLTEYFDISVRMFELKFGVNMKHIKSNENINRAVDGYVIDSDAVELINVHKSLDLALYERAKELFSQQCARYCN